MGNYPSPLKRAFEGGFNGDAADSTEFCVVNCIANRSAKSCFWRESEKINKPQKFLRVLANNTLIRVSRCSCTRFQRYQVQSQEQSQEQAPTFFSFFSFPFLFFLYHL